MEDVILGSGTLLFIDATTPPDTPVEEVSIPGDFVETICLLDNSFGLTVSPIDTTSKCTGLWATSIPGQKSGTFGGNGEAVIIEDSDPRYNMDKIVALAASATVVWWLQYNDNQTSIRYATGYVSSYSDAVPNLDKQGFSFTVTLTGEIYVAIQTT